MSKSIPTITSSSRKMTLSTRLKMVSFVMVFALFCLFTGARSQRAKCGSATLWMKVPEDQYDRNYSSINDPEARPIGFERGTVLYDSPSEPNLCIEVSDTEDARVEILVESYPAGSVVCVSDDRGIESCDAQISDCRQTGTGNTLTFEFYCDAESCDESDVQIFYRFTVSPPGSGDGNQDPELWCDFRDKEYPSGLAVPLPPNKPLPTAPPDRTSGAGPDVKWNQACMIGLLLTLLSLTSYFGM